MAVRQPGDDDVLIRELLHVPVTPPDRQTRRDLGIGEGTTAEVVRILRRSGQPQPPLEIVKKQKPCFSPTPTWVPDIVFST